MTTANVTNMYDFLDVIDKHDDMRGIELVSRFNKMAKSFNADAAKWVHSMGVERNNPDAPVQASLKFKARCEELVSYITSDKAGELRDESIALTGRGAFSAAYRKIYAAMKEGGDLLTLQTTNQCEQYVKEKNKADEQAETEAALRAELKAQGLDPDSPENLALLKGGKVDEEDKADDALDMLAKEFNDVMHQMATAGISEHEIQQQARSSIDRLLGKLESVTNAAGGTGFVKQSA